MITATPVQNKALVLEAFFTERLQQQRQASAHTIAAYRDTFRLLLGFAEQHLGKAPSDLLLADVNVSFVAAFLDHLEKKRRNGARTRTRASPPSGRSFASRRRTSRSTPR